MIHNMESSDLNFKLLKKQFFGSKFEVIKKTIFDSINFVGIFFNFIKSVFVDKKKRDFFF